MTQKIRAGPPRPLLAMLAVFLAMLYGCEKMFLSNRTGRNPVGVERNIENMKIPDGEKGTVTGSVLLLPGETDKPMTVHIEGFRGTAVTVASGERFVLDNVPVGYRRVLVYDQPPEDLATPPSVGMQSDFVTVGANETTDIGTLTLVAAGSITGTVNGMEGVETFVTIPGTWFITQPDRSGAYTLQGVPEGSYRLDIQRAGSFETYSDLVNVTRGSQVTVPPIAAGGKLTNDGGIALDQGAAYTPSRSVPVDISQEPAATEIMMSESPTFKGAQWQPVVETVEYTFGSDGVHKLYAKFRKLHKYITGAVSDEIYVDTVPPVVTIAASGGDAYTNVPDITLAITAKDMVGVVSMMVSEDPSFAGAAWEPFSQSRVFALSAGEGMKTIHLKVKDQIGLVSDPVSIEVGYDTQTPVATAIAVVEGAYTGTRLIGLKPAIADAAPMRWALVSERSDFAGASWQDYKEPMPFTLSAGEGQKVIYARFRDGAGNTTATVSTTTVLDLTPPTTPAISNISRRVDSSTKTETIVITTPSTDALFKSYVAKGGNYANWTEVSDPITFTLGSDNSWYDLEIRGKDLAGNMSGSATVRIFRGAASILDGSTASLTGAARSAGSLPATLGMLFAPYLIEGAAGGTTFTDYNLVVDAGVSIGVAAGVDVAITGLTVNGTAGAHVTLQSAASTKAAGDWSILTLSGALSLSYLDAAHYAIADIDQSAVSAVITDSSFTSFSLYGLRDYSTGATSLTNTSITCPSTVLPTGYLASSAASAVVKNLTAVDVEKCKIGISVSGTPVINLTGSNVAFSTKNVYILSSASGAITFTGNYFGYGQAGGSLDNLHITDNSLVAPLTWSDYVTIRVPATGQR